MIVSLLVSRPVISQSIQTRGCLERDSGIAAACVWMEMVFKSTGILFSCLDAVGGRMSGR